MGGWASSWKLCAYYSSFLTAKAKVAVVDNYGVAGSGTMKRPRGGNFLEIEFKTCDFGVGVRRQALSFVSFRWYQLCYLLCRVDCFKMERAFVYALLYFAFLRFPLLLLRFV